MTRPDATPTLLRTALRLDAAASGAMGALLALGAGPLAGPLGLPEPLLREAGLLLVPFAAAVAYLGRRAPVPRAAAAAVVAVNLGWVAASAALLALPAVAPSALGTAFVVAQALAVLGFAEAQWVGLRRGARAARAAGPAAA